MTFEELCQRLQEQFGEAIKETRADAPDPFVVVEAARLHEVAAFARDAQGLRIDNVADLTAVDLPAEEKIQVVYHLFSYAHHHPLVLKVDLPRAAPKVDSVADLWPGAEWFEREVFDLVGVEFVGNPDLRRLLLPEDWEGFPLRKDYEEKVDYHDMPTRRTFSNELFDQLDAQVRAARPFKALLVYDDSGRGAQEAGETIAIRLRVADIDTELKPVSQANAAHLQDYDLLIFGANSTGLLFGGPSAKLGAFIDLMPDIGEKPCALYVVYTAHPGEAMRELDTKVRRKKGKIIAQGAVPRRWPRRDPDDLAASLVDLIRRGALPRPPAPEPPPAEAAADAPAAAGTAVADKAAQPATDKASGADAS